MVRKQKDPIWRPTPRMRAENPELPEAVPPGPDNPLGHRAMYLGWSQYLIHGTNKPLGIGRRASSGCVRMYPEDIEYLFDRIAIGTKVTVVDQPIKLSWIDDALYIEAHPTQAQSDQIEASGSVRPDPRQPRGRPGAGGGRRASADAGLEPDPRRRPSSGAAIRSGSRAEAKPSRMMAHVAQGPRRRVRRAMRARAAATAQPAS